jgi:hypothetical protein
MVMKEWQKPNGWEHVPTLLPSGQVSKALAPDSPLPTLYTSLILAIAAILNNVICLFFPLANIPVHVLLNYWITGALSFSAIVVGFIGLIKARPEYITSKTKSLTLLNFVFTLISPVLFCFIPVVIYMYSGGK